MLQSKMVDGDCMRHRGIHSQRRERDGVGKVEKGGGFRCCVRDLFLIG